MSAWWVDFLLALSNENISASLSPSIAANHILRVKIEAEFEASGRESARDRHVWARHRPLQGYDPVWDRRQDGEHQSSGFYRDSLCFLPTQIILIDDAITASVFASFLLHIYSVCNFDNPFCICICRVMLRPHQKSFYDACSVSF